MSARRVARRAFRDATGSFLAHPERVRFSSSGTSLLNVETYQRVATSVYPTVENLVTAGVSRDTLAFLFGVDHSWFMTGH